MATEALAPAPSSAQETTPSSLKMMQHDRADVKPHHTVRVRYRKNVHKIKELLFRACGDFVSRHEKE
jgi:hypothetical protein